MCPFGILSNLRFCPFGILSDSSFVYNPFDKVSCFNVKLFLLLLLYQKEQENIYMLDGALDLFHLYLVGKRLSYDAFVSKQ